MKELKKCPFCGAPATINCFVHEGFDSERGYFVDKESYCVRCQKCGNGTAAYENKENAIEFWQARVKD